MHDNMSMKLELYTETCVTTNGAAAVEALRSELVLAKEQTRMSNLAPHKAAEELKTEQAVRRQCEEKITTMARKLEETTIRSEFLEKDNKSRTVNLDKALQEAKEA